MLIEGKVNVWFVVELFVDVIVLDWIIVMKVGDCLWLDCEVYKMVVVMLCVD